MLQYASIILVTVILLNAMFNVKCEEYTISPDNGTFAEQVINVTNTANNSGDKFITILVYSGNYTATNGSLQNFIAFQNVNISKHPKSSDPVNVMCLDYITASHNGIGFENSVNIHISGLNFMNCGITTAGLYFYNITNLSIADSTFNHNLENGIQIVSGNNIKIINCHFFHNIGLQLDDASRLVTKTNVNATGGVGLGLLLVNLSNVSISIINCNFTENISYRTVNFSSDTRPFAFIPSGNGGGLDIQVDKITNLYAEIINCHFYGNIAIHQGGGIIITMIDSVNSRVNVSGSRFIGNKALGYLLRNYNQTVDLDNINDFDIDDFIHSINSKLNIDELLRDINAPNAYATLQDSGGFGGAIAMTIYENAAYNELFVTDSYFSKNLAIFAGTIGFAVRDEGAVLNRAVITKCTFINNAALFQGSAIASPSYARIDTATAPILINDCIFENNQNMLPNLFLYRFDFFGAVSTLRFPLTFGGKNVFHNNTGGGLSATHARINIGGYMEFSDNREAVFGGALRLGELTLIQVLPNAIIAFLNNRALRFGGAIAVENYRAANDTTLVLLSNCFIQYNIGSAEANNPNEWTSRFIFNNNKLADEDGQGQTIFADNIGSCLLPQLTESSSVFNSSIFAVPRIFNFTNNGNRRNLVTAPNKLIIENDTIEASPGEIFSMILNAVDDNNNSKDAVYSYAAPLEGATGALSSIVIDLAHTGNDRVSFASISRMGGTRQKISFVIHNEYTGSDNFSFTLNLVDSSTGQAVYAVNKAVNLQHCHAGYEFKNKTGGCVFSHSLRSGFRPDKRNRYLYIQPDRYGGLDPDGNFLTARIPPSYQNCQQEGKLPGCLVMDDRDHEQCSQGRNGFLCGRCTKGSENTGIALNLIECVPCDVSDIIYFILLCIVIVAISILIIYFNIGLPSGLKEFLFFIQVVGYIYRTGVTNGRLEWNFYLSRFFGFSFFVPLCISSDLETVEAVVLGFVPPLLMIMSIITYILLARFFALLSKRKTVDGIWFLALIAYVYTADTCLNLLRCVQVYEPIDEFKGKQVYYFDGSLECFSGGHLPYGIVATVIAAVFLIPFPLYMLAIGYNFVKNAGPLRDIICNGIKPRYVWWSSYDLFRRLLFVIVYLLFENFNSDYTQFALTISALLILIVTSRTHPYTQIWANIVNWLILLDLVLLSAYFVNFNKQKDSSDNSTAIVLLLLPFIYSGLYLIGTMLHILWNRNVVGNPQWLQLHPRVRRKLVSHYDTLRRWSTAVFLNGHHDESMTPSWDMTRSSGKYEEYRDELDDYVTVDDFHS